MEASINRRWALALLLLLGCRQPATAIALAIDCAPATTFSALSVRVRSQALGLDSTRSFEAAAAPTQLLIPVADVLGSVQVDVEAVDGARVRSASSSVTTEVHQTVSLRLDLSLPSGCGDGQRNGTEVAVDCGGTCPACEVGTACRSDADCATRACAPQGICALASGPPGWVLGPALTPSRGRLAGASTPQGVVALGGVSEGGAPLSLAQRLEGGAWVALPALSSARASLGAAWFDGKLWALGGEDAGTTVETLGAGAWVPGPPLKVEHPTVAAAAVEGRLVVAGGASVESFTADAGWTSAAPLTTPRTALALAAMGDGSVYAVGGRQGSTDLRTVAQLLPAQNTWVSAPQLPTARSGLAAVGAPDGRLWAIGGSSFGTALDAVEAYFPPPVGVWVTLPFLRAHRAGVAAAIAPDGRLVVFGGLETSGTQPSSSEAYGPVVALSPARLAVGAKGSVSGTNFAASAHVVATLQPGGVVVARGDTDASGTLPAVSFTLPTLPAGAYSVTVIDDRSRYPIRLALEVAP